jgi:hypothetical protein
MLLLRKGRRVRRPFRLRTVGANHAVSHPVRAASHGPPGRDGRRAAGVAAQTVNCLYRVHLLTFNVSVPTSKRKVLDHDRLSHKHPRDRRLRIAST